MTAARRVGAAALALCGAAAAAPCAARAQSTKARAAATLAAGDSLGALAALDRAVAASPHDAAAWNLRGRLALRLLRPGAKVTALVNGLTQFELHEVASHSLRQAAGLAPDSARYVVDLGQLALVDYYAEARSDALLLFDQALDVARRVEGPRGFADIADAIGVLLWREYEWAGLRPTVPGKQGDQRDTAAARQLVGGLTQARNFPVPREAAVRAGRAEYLVADALFAAAHQAVPGDTRHLRRLGAWLAEWRRWEELGRVGARAVSADSSDPAAWLTLAMAQHRLQRFTEADSAYATAFSLMGPAEVERFTRLSRILLPEDARRFEQMNPAERVAAAKRAWLFLDPLWASPGNELLLEYLSRVTQAWMRWDAPHPGAHAADGEHGAALVTLGPPAEIEAYPTSVQADRLSVFWLYPRAERARKKTDFRALRRADRDIRLVFTRDRLGTAEQLRADVRPVLARYREQMPISWDNVALAQSVDSAAVHTARFRVAGADSADVYVAAHLPIAEMVGDLDLARFPLQVDLWVLDERGRRVLRDSTLAVIAPADSAAASVRVWRRRLPAGSYYYRVEAWQPEQLRGARGVAPMAGPGSGALALHDFGLSDILVAERVSPRGEVTPSTRWSEFNIVPNAGLLRRGQPYALLWEVYDVAERDGAARYRVDVTLRARDGSPARSLLTQVLAGTDAAAGLNGRGNERVSLGYERRLTHSPVSVNYLVLQLGGAPPGDYTVEVRVTDRLSGRTAVRAVGLTVVE